MEYQIHVTKVESQPTAVVRLLASHGELSRVVPAACGEVWAFARSAGLAQPGRHLALYLDGAINLEVGVEVAESFVGNERVVPSSTPAGLVATTAHFGPYERLAEAHAALHQWCAAHGYTLAGPSWEIYGHWTDDPAQLRTDVFYLVQATDTDSSA